MSGGVRCNLSEEDKERIWDGFDDDLTQEEEERVEALFHPHLFYTSITRNRKACYCEACKSSFEVTRSSARLLWVGKHGDALECPKCGAQVELICEGRIQTGARLEESKCVMVIRADPDGALRIYGGLVTRKYERCDYFDDWNNVLHRALQPVLSFEQSKRYYLAPRGRMCWKHGWWNYFGRRVPYDSWEERRTIVQAFTPSYYGYWQTDIFDGQCNVIGAEQIRKSYAKYSQAIEWIYGCDEPQDSERVFGLEQYLAAYIDYPQLEFAVKMGEEDAVRDLVFRGVKNHRALNWKAKDPASFYRMDKQQFRRYTAAGGKTKDLLTAKELGVPLDDILTAKAAVGDSQVRGLLSCADAAGVTVAQAIRYIGKEHRTIMEWSDYLSMAGKLNYDLTSKEITTPKNLTAAHNRAAELLQTETDKTINQKYKRRRYGLLRKKYEMEYAGMLVRVPENSIEIATEGKVLEHCVGGYAKRHLEGKTVILFLRRADAPTQPLVTIEMDPDSKTIRQIHGWRNERMKINGAFPPSPRETYAEFLDVWLEWLAADSPRTSTGKPIYKVKINQEVQSA